MGLGFGNVKGGATSEKMDQYEFKNGDNSVRMFGSILPRYLYWIKRPGSEKAVPFECLSFNRETETFDNSLEDPVKELFPDLKCKWGYSILCVPAGGDKDKIFNFKKKLFDQIMANVDDLGDPTDPEDGWILHFTKQKVGPLPINVEYTMQVVKCLKSKGPLSEEEKNIISKAKPIEEMLERPTAEKQREQLEKFLNGNSSENDNIDESVEEELNVE